MDVFTRENIDQAIVPATLEQIEQDIPEILEAMAQVNNNGLPIWYVLTLASGETGIPLQRLYDDPMTRKHALGALSVKSQAERLQGGMCERGRATVAAHTPSVATQPPNTDDRKDG
jgi:hypothetical protein